MELLLFSIVLKLLKQKMCFLVVFIGKTFKFVSFIYILEDLKYLGIIISKLFIFNRCFDKSFLHFYTICSLKKKTHTLFCSLPTNTNFLPFFASCEFAKVVSHLSRFSYNGRSVKNISKKT